jgi:hypothetical protein
MGGVLCRPCASLEVTGERAEDSASVADLSPTPPPSKDVEGIVVQELSLPGPEQPLAQPPPMEETAAAAIVSSPPLQTSMRSRLSQPFDEKYPSDTAAQAVDGSLSAAASALSPPPIRMESLQSQLSCQRFDVNSQRSKTSLTMGGDASAMPNLTTFQSLSVPSLATESSVSKSRKTAGDGSRAVILPPEADTEIRRASHADDLTTFPHDRRKRSSGGGVDSSPRLQNDSLTMGGASPAMHMVTFHVSVTSDGSGSGKRSDEHLHTSNGSDSDAFGVPRSPEVALRPARGNPLLISPIGVVPVQVTRSRVSGSVESGAFVRATGGSWMESLQSREQPPVGTVTSTSWNDGDEAQHEEGAGISGEEANWHLVRFQQRAEPREQQGKTREHQFAPTHQLEGGC